MRLELQGSRTITASPERIWARLVDPVALTAGASAVQSVEAVAPDHFRVTVAVGLGFFKLRVPLEVTLADLIPGERGTMRVAGEAMGTALTARTSFTLHAVPEGTRLDWTADGEAEGKLAKLSGDALEGTARVMAEKFWDDFAAKVGGEA